MSKTLYNIGIIIQARLTSKRFPGKIKEKIGTTSLLEHLVDRARSVEGVNKVIIACPHSPEICLNEEIFIGSEEDVLKRYYDCATAHRLTHVIRVTADCPFVPVFEIERCLQRILQGDTEYVTNRPSVPDGWDVEAFTYEALAKTHKESTEPEEREHVTIRMKKDHSLNPIFLERPKLSIDTTDDLTNMRRWYELERKVDFNHWWNGQLCNELYTTSVSTTQTKSDKDILP